MTLQAIISRCGYVRETTSAAARAECLALCLSCTYSVHVPFWFAVSAARHALSRSILCFLFSSVVSGFLRRSLP